MASRRWVPCALVLLAALTVLVAVVTSRQRPPRGGLSRAAAIVAATPDRRTFQAAPAPARAEVGHCELLAKATSREFTSSGPLIPRVCDARWAWRVDWQCATNHPPAQLHIFVSYLSGKVLFVQGFECGDHGPCCAGHDIPQSERDATLYGDQRDGPPGYPISEPRGDVPFLAAAID